MHRFAYLLIVIASTASAQQLPMPRLFWVFPVGAKRGETVELQFGGQNLDGASKLYFSNPAIQAEAIPGAKKDEPIRKFKVTVPADVAPGMVDVRLVSDLGISTPRTFVISESAEFVEDETKQKNDQRETATPIPFNSVVNGKVAPSADVDWYAIEAKKGQRLLIDCKDVEIDSMAIGAIFLTDSEGRQLASSQGAALQPIIDVDIPADGKYYVKVHDLRYRGDDNHFYRLEVGSFPRIDFVLPNGIPRSASPEEKHMLKVFGRNLPGGKPTGLLAYGRPVEETSVAVASAVGNHQFDLAVDDRIYPPASRLDAADIQLNTTVGASNSKMLVLSDIAETAEIEPNNEPAVSQKIAIPAAITGSFNPNDVDTYVFPAKKGEPFVVEVWGQRIGSPVDAYAEIHGPKGETVAQGQDDRENIGELRFPSTCRDVRIEFAAKNEGDHRIVVEHLYREVQGGPQYAYRLVVRRPEPDFRLVATPKHEIHATSLVVYQGGREQIDVLAWRLDGHDEPIHVEARNLPPGVHCDPIVIGPGVKGGALIVTADPGAASSEGEIEIIGRSQAGEREVTRVARGGGIVWDTVNTAASSRLTRSIVLAVRPNVPFAATATVEKTTVTQGEPLKIRVDVKRSETMKNPIKLKGGHWNPANFVVPLTDITADKTTATISVPTDKVKPGTYSTVIDSEGQVVTAKTTIRCVYPSNSFTFTIAEKK